MHPNEQYVRDFFLSWEKGAFADLCASYRHFLAEDVLYENSGVPPCHGSEEAVRLIESVCLTPIMDIQTIKVDIRNIAAIGNIVFTERVDSHYNRVGEATLVPYICGVMEFEGGKIKRWADYYDPIPMLEAFK